MPSTGPTWGSRRSDYRIHQNLAPAPPPKATPKAKSIRQNFRTRSRIWPRAVSTFINLWLKLPGFQTSERPLEEIPGDNDLDDDIDDAESSCLLEQTMNLSIGQDFITSFTNELQAVGDVPSVSACKDKIITYSFTAS